MKRTASTIWLILCVLSVGACSTLERVQCSMERMADNTSVMASVMPVMGNSTAAMAYNTDRMIARLDSMIAEFNKKGKTAERSVENYTQAFFDNERAVINNLKGLREELRELRKTVGPVSPQTGIPDRAPLPQDMQSRLTEIENRLKTLSTKIDQVEKTKPSQ